MNHGSNMDQTWIKLPVLGAAIWHHLAMAIHGNPWIRSNFGIVSPSRLGHVAWDAPKIRQIRLLRMASNSPLRSVLSVLRKPMVCCLPGVCLVQLLEFV